MTTWDGYEYIHNLDLPPLPDFYLGRRADDRLSWDYDGNYPVDFDELVELGYFRKVRITEHREYL